MARPSELSTPADFALEHQREDLRDRRSSRHRRNAEVISGALAKAIGTLVSAAGLVHLLGWF